MTQKTPYGTIGYRTRTQLGSLERLEGITSIIREQRITPARDYVLAAADIGKGTYDPKEFALRVGSTDAPLLVKPDMRAQIVLAAFGMMTNAARAQEVVVRDYKPDLKAWRAVHGIKLPTYLSILERLSEPNPQNKSDPIERFHFRSPPKDEFDKYNLRSPLQRMWDEDAEHTERKRKEHERRYGIIPLEEFPIKINQRKNPSNLLEVIKEYHLNPTDALIKEYHLNPTDEQIQPTLEEELKALLRLMVARKKPINPRGE